MDGSVKCIESELPFDLPDGWVWCRFYMIANIFGVGLVRSNEQQKELAGYQYFKMNNIENFTGQFNLLNMPLVRATINEVERFSLADGDFLFNTRNSYELVGKTTVVRGISGKKILYNNNILKITFRNDVLPEYINYYCVSNIGQTLLRSFASNTTNVAAIYQRQITTMLVPLPPFAEQRRIVSAVESAFAVIDEIENNKTDLHTAVITAKSKILSLAVCGKLVPQDPNDEPASALLERIRTERENLIKTGKLKRNKNESIITRSDDNSYYSGLPRSWELVTLSHVTNSLTLNDGNWILSENMVSKGDVKLIQLGSVGYMEYVDKGFKYLTSERFTELNCTTIFPNYLLINRLLGDRLNVCILPNISGILITTVDTCWIAPNKHYNQKFLMYSIASKRFQDNVFLNSAGSTRKRISKGNLIQIPFAFPPLAEQQRIVIAIETAFKQLDSISAMVE